MTWPLGQPTTVPPVCRQCSGRRIAVHDHYGSAPQSVDGTIRRGLGRQVTCRDCDHTWYSTHAAVLAFPVAEGAAQ